MSFAFVQFGDHKSTIFNTNCRNVSLLSSLKEICNQVCGKDDRIELAAENGECKNLFRSPEGYACEVIAPREKLILLRIEDASRTDNLAGLFKFVPLVSGLQENKEFMNLLNPTAQKGQGIKVGAGKAKIFVNNVPVSNGNQAKSSKKQPAAVDGASATRLLAVPTINSRTNTPTVSARR